LSAIMRLHALRQTKIPRNKMLTLALGSHRTPYATVYLHLDHPSGIS
jgi:hypothetical protein